MAEWSSSLVEGSRRPDHQTYQSFDYTACSVKHCSPRGRGRSFVATVTLPLQGQGRKLHSGKAGPFYGFPPRFQLRGLRIIRFIERTEFGTAPFLRILAVYVFFFFCSATFLPPFSRDETPLTDVSVSFPHFRILERFHLYLPFSLFRLQETSPSVKRGCLLLIITHSLCSRNRQVLLRPVSETTRSALGGCLWSLVM